MAFHPNQQMRLLDQDFDPTAMMRQKMSKEAPWASIVDFATHPDFCGLPLYPRQRTLLKLIFLETENFTEYDRDVIGQWMEGFCRPRDTFGVQPDILDRVAYLKARGYRRFPHIQLVVGRRGAKGLLCAILGTEQIAYFHALGDWQAHYGVVSNKAGYLSVVATSQSQAKRHQFADIRGLVETCKYLQPHLAFSKDYELGVRTAADLSHLAQLQAAHITPEHEIASLRAIAVSTVSDVVRGAAGFCNVYDESAHFLQTDSSKSGDEIYEAGQPALDQFGKDGLTLLPSSPFTKIGFFFRLYQLGSILIPGTGGTVATEDQLDINADKEIARLGAEPEMLILQLPSWGLYLDWEKGVQLTGMKFRAPIQWPPIGDRPENERMRRLRSRNPDKFRVERESQFAEVLGQYLDRDKVAAIFDAPNWRDPLSPAAFGRLDYAYRIHADPSTVGANFALCVAHTELAPPDTFGDRWPHVIIDRLHVWQPKDFPANPETGKREIDYTAVERELDALLYTFPSTTKFSTDQFHSTGLLQRLRVKYSPAIRIVEETATEKTNWERAEKFKSAINLGWVHSFRDAFYEDGTCLLEQECNFLSEKNGKVHKQDFGPVTTKDLYDAVSVVTVDLLHDALERWTTGRLTGSAYGSTFVPGLKSGDEFERVAQGGFYRNGNRGTSLYQQGTQGNRDLYRTGTYSGAAGGRGARDNAAMDRRRRAYREPGYGSTGNRFPTRPFRSRDGRF